MLRPLVTAVVLSLALVAPAGSAIDPCALVTQAEAGTAMGVAAQAAKKTNTRNGGSCRYYNADHTRNVFVQMVSPDTPAGVASAMHLKPVPGIAAQAYWLGGSYFMVKGGTAAQVGLYTSAASMKTMEPAGLVLAKLAAGRL